MQLVKGVPLDVFVGAAAGGADVATQEVEAEAQDWTSTIDPMIWVFGEARREPVEPLGETEALINAPEASTAGSGCGGSNVQALTHIHDQRIIHRDSSSQQMFWSLMRVRSFQMDFPGYRCG